MAGRHRIIKQFIQFLGVKIFCISFVIDTNTIRRIIQFVKVPDFYCILSFTVLRDALKNSII